ncbi:MAG: tRNA (adenosine(37)-N6)-threonylcarbamoyltransferase complex dimerization subunit type 1 TsaB [Pseudomonadota bacterium]
MPSEPAVLAFDTSAAHCAAALLLRGQVLTVCETMQKGQAERLMPLLQEFLRANRLDFSNLTRIGVGVGPGNFTGIRIAVSAARGLSLSLGVRAVGVSGFDATRLASGKSFAAIPAPRETAYIQKNGGDPRQVPLADVPADAAWPDPEAQVAAIARLAAAAPADTLRPTPLYIRAADAAPAREAPPVILDAGT